MKKINLKFYIFISLLLSAVVIIWFSPIKQLATGEEGFSIFNYIAPEDQISFWQNSGTGYPIPFYITRLIPILLTNVITKLLIPLFLIQAGFFLFILLAGFTGSFFLTRFFFQDNILSFRIAFVAALFYCFNLYTMSQVFNRFLYSSMSLWSYLPWFLLFWIKWINEGKVKHIVIFLSASLVFSLSYSQPAHILTLWTPAVIWSLISVVNKKIHYWNKTIFLTVLGVLLWLMINSWWIDPYIQLQSFSMKGVSEVAPWQANFDSLRGVSKFFPIQEILILKQGFLFGIDSQWYSFYSDKWVVIISIVVVLITILGWFLAKGEKCRSYLTILALIGLFISKGSNPPLGFDFYRWLFEHIPQTMVLRNPYEKFGLVWLLPYSIFFGYGVNFIYQKLKIQLRILFITLTILLTCVILVWPMWTGTLYTDSARVIIPKYLKEANQFINEDRSDGRILMLPLIPGDGIKYDWGYVGVEPSEFFFSKPSISKILRTNYFDDKYMDLYNKFINNIEYNNLLEEMNIKYLVLHHDLVNEASGASSSAQVEEDLKNNPNIRLLENFGKLSVYEFIGDKEGKLFITEREEVPNLSYEKFGPTSYRVNIKNAKPPFSLVFKTTFNELWEARISGKKIDDHFLVHGYANGWRIDKGGSYVIDIIFKIWPWE